MNIRDISGYIKSICGAYDISKLRTNEEPFRKEVFGRQQNGNATQVLIKSCASFANEAQEQLFYEFVQNAYDADADTLAFYGNEKYLIVLNNGKPFYTDAFSPEGNRQGQLYSFLAKNDSDKSEDDSKLGNYGQGSKLLYTLIADVDNDKSNESLITEAIYDNKKGPYLISWNDKTQLCNLLLNRNQWTLSDFADEKNNLLFVKILLTYFPICPGVDERWFSAEEAHDAIDAFDKLVDPRRSMHLMNQGTALIIPLGAGKYEKIANSTNLDNVKKRLVGFSAITRNIRQSQRSIDNIYVMGEKISISNIKCADVEVTIKSKDGNDEDDKCYHFLFGEEFAKPGMVNLYKGLPIMSAKYSLGFIVDSQSLEVDNSRQRIQEADKTGEQLRKAFTLALEEIDSLRQTNVAKYDIIYRSLIASDLKNNNEDADFIINAFKDVFSPYLREHVRTVSGEYLPLNQVRYKTYRSDIPLADIGVTAYQLADEECYESLKRHDLKPKNLSLKELLLDSDKDKRVQWIKILSREQYKLFQKEVDSCVLDGTQLRNYLLYRSNAGNVYSYNDLCSDICVFYSYADDAEISFGNVEHIIYRINGHADINFSKNLIRKIQSNIDFFRTDSQYRDVACDILAWISAWLDKSYCSSSDTNEVRKIIREKVALFANMRGEYLPFNELLLERPQGTTLYDMFCVSGRVPDNAKKWFVDKQGYWAWVKSHQNAWKNEDWGGKNTMIFLSDIKKVYNDCPYDKRGDAFITLYLDDEGMPVNDKVFMLNGWSELLDEEYSLVRKNADTYDLVKYDYADILSEKPFKLESVDVKDLIESERQISKQLLAIFVKLKVGDYMIDKYRIAESNDGFSVKSLRQGEKNYMDDVSSDILETLDGIGYYQVPGSAQRICAVNNIGNHTLMSNEDFIKEAISRLGYKASVLLPLVRKCNKVVKEYFLDAIKTIDVDEPLDEDSIQCQLIDFALDEHFDGTLFDMIRYKGERLPEDFNALEVKIGNKKYNLSDLDEKYKEENSTIESFLNCLPSECAKRFREEYYDAKAKEVPTQEIFDKLKKCYLNIKQLEFCLDFSLSNKEYNGLVDDLEIGQNESLEKALDMVRKRNFKGFDKYFKMPGYNRGQQIYAPDEYLLDEECLPENIHAWMDKNKDALELFSCLKVDESDPFIVFRKSIAEDVDMNAELDLDNEMLDPTIDWLLEQELDYRDNSNRFRLVFGLIEKLPGDYDPMPMLRYTGETDEANGVSKTMFTLEEYDKSGAFMKMPESFAKELHNNGSLQNFFREEQIVYIFSERSFLSKHDWDDAERTYRVETAANEDVAYQEWDNDTYQRWKKEKESKGITIHTSGSPIDMNLSIKTVNDITIWSDRKSSEECGWIKNKKIIVQQPNPSDKNVMKTIESYLSRMEFFQLPFVLLQSMYIDDLEKKADGATSGEVSVTDSQLDITTAQNVVNTITRQTAMYINEFNNIGKSLSSTQIAGLSNQASKMKALLSLSDVELKRLTGLSKEELKELSELLKDGLNGLKKRLKNQQSDDDNEPRISNIIGYIGEQLYYQYLEKKKRDFDYVAVKGEGAYDFEDKTKGRLIDIKATIKSVSDGTAPFYIHKSQRCYLQGHPDAKYYIVRISLDDLGLKSEYYSIREKYGKDANPSDNVELRDACKQVAQRYWETGKIGEFESRIAEYKIRSIPAGMA